MNFGLTIPMTDITKVLGQNTHPFYKDLKDAGFVPASEPFGAQHLGVGNRDDTDVRLDDGECCIQQVVETVWPDQAYHRDHSASA